MSHLGKSPNPGDRPPGGLMAECYDELRAVAKRHLAGERCGHTLQPTALVNEAYLRLNQLNHVGFDSRTEFFAAAAGTIRRILIDHARGRQALKRGGGWKQLTLSGLAEDSALQQIDLLALDDALQALERRDPQLMRIVELRFFGGLSIEQTARELGVGVTTVKDRWTFARAWLRRELDGCS